VDKEKLALLCKYFSPLAPSQQQEESFIYLDIATIRDSTKLETSNNWHISEILSVVSPKYVLLQKDLLEIVLFYHNAVDLSRACYILRFSNTICVSKNRELGNFKISPDSLT
jgi:hypothetical protein